MDYYYIYNCLLLIVGTGLMHPGSVTSQYPEDTNWSCYVVKKGHFVTIPAVNKHDYPNEYILIGSAFARCVNLLGIWNGGWNPGVCDASLIDIDLRYDPSVTWDITYLCQGRKKCNISTSSISIPITCHDYEELLMAVFYRMSPNVNTCNQGGYYMEEYQLCIYQTKELNAWEAEEQCRVGGGRLISMVVGRKCSFWVRGTGLTPRTPLDEFTWCPELSVVVTYESDPQSYDWNVAYAHLDETLQQGLCAFPPQCYKSDCGNPPPTTIPTTSTTITPSTTTSAVPTKTTHSTTYRSTSSTGSSPSRTTSTSASPESTTGTATTTMSTSTSTTELTTTIGTSSSAGTTTTTPISTKKCPACSASGMAWPESKPGLVQLRCINNAVGLAKWYCQPNGKWQGQFPDLSNCEAFKDIWDTGFKELDNLQPARVVLETILSKIRARKATFHAGDVHNAVEVLSSSVSLQKNQTAECLANSSAPNCRQHVHDYASSAVTLASEALFDPYCWLSNPDFEEIASNLFETIEQIGSQATKLLIADKFTSEWINMESVTSVTSQKYITDDFHYTYADGSAIYLPDEAKKDGNINGTWMASVVLFNNMHSILGNNMRYNMSFPSGEGNISSIVNCKVVGSTIGNHTDGITFSKGKVILHLNHILTGDRYDISNATCVFWDTGSHKWSTSGCRLVNTSDVYSICECDHLTNLALLVDYGGFTEKDEPTQILISYVTIFGCCVSAVCLLCALGIFFAVRSLESLRVFIHGHLCFSLLVAQVTLLAGLDATGTGLTCKVAALMIHFFFLVAFGWMLVEGYQIYLMLVVVFLRKPSSKSMMLLVGYGGPAIIVSISVVMRWDGYGTEKHCWLSRDKGLIWAFLGPVAAVLLFNMSVLVIALRKARMAVKSLPGRSSRSSRESRAWMKGCASLSVILGLTWAIGFLMFDDEPPWLIEMLELAFSVLNSLQGVFILLFHCILKADVRQALGRKLQWNSYWHSRSTVGVSVPTTQSKSLSDPDKLFHIRPKSNMIKT